MYVFRTRIESFVLPILVAPLSVDGANLYPAAHQVSTRVGGFVTLEKVFLPVAWWVPFAE